MGVLTRIILILLPMLFFVNAGVAQTTVRNVGERCHRGCDDPSGGLTVGSSCPLSSPYCCGDRTNQNCCSDHRKRIDFRDVLNYCNQRGWSTWWIAQWRVIVGMLTSLIVILCCVSACYYCCGGEGLCSCCDKCRPGRPARGVETGSVSYSVDSESTSVPRIFNPTSPYAFEPPAYESLPKDPPKYADIWQGEENAGFVNETSPENSNSPSNTTSTNIPQRSNRCGPPTYSESETIRAEESSTGTEAAPISNARVNGEAPQDVGQPSGQTPTTSNNVTEPSQNGGVSASTRPPNNENNKETVGGSSAIDDNSNSTTNRTATNVSHSTNSNNNNAILSTVHIS